MVDVLYVSESEVKRLLPFTRAVELARAAYVKLARGEAVNPQRAWLTVPGGASMYFMPAYIVGQRSVVVKAARVNAGNGLVSLPTVLLTIYVYDSTTGVQLAEIEGENLTAIRTAASTAVATDVLARRSVESLGVFGAGREAETHVAALRIVRSFSTVLVYSRSREKREEFARRIFRECGIETVPADSPEWVVKESDVIVTATTSNTPVFDGGLVRKGCHINAIGAATPDAREVDTELVRRSRVVVDSREQALSSYGDILIPTKEDVIKKSDILELGEILIGRTRVLRSNEEITLFKSGGLAVLDAVAADYIVESVSQKR